METLNGLAATLLSHLAWASAQAVLLAGLVALVILLRPRLSSSARCALWWLVGLQLVVGLCWQSPISFRVPAPSIAITASTTSIANSNTLLRARPLAAPASRADPSTRTSSSVESSSWLDHWRLYVAALWLLGLLVQLPSIASQYRRLRRLRRNAGPDANLQAMCTSIAQRMGVHPVPTLLVSDRVDSPMISGVWRPIILWPAGHVLDADDTSLALTHELAHVRRGDLWMCWVPAIAQRLFFFHPVVHWAAHEYALHREAACDALAMDRQNARLPDYGRLLLRLGVARSDGVGLASASPTFRVLKRRLLMLQRGCAATSPRTWVLVALIALVGAVPYQVVAATGTPNAPSAARSQQPGDGSLTRKAVTPPAVGSSTQYRETSNIDPDAAEGFALFDGGWVLITGTGEDNATARRLHKPSEPMIYVRRGGKAYVIRDRAIVDRAKHIYTPVLDLSQQQGQLGSQQGEIGRERGRIGQEQGELGAKEAAMALAQADAAVRQARLQLAGGASENKTDATAAGSSRPDHSIDSQMHDLEARQDRLQQQQSAMEAKQGALETRRQQALQRAAPQMNQLIKEAIASGLAHPVDRS